MIFIITEVLPENKKLTHALRRASKLLIIFYLQCVLVKYSLYPFDSRAFGSSTQGDCSWEIFKIIALLG